MDRKKFALVNHKSKWKNFYAVTKIRANINSMQHDKLLYNDKGVYSRNLPYIFRYSGIRIHPILSGGSRSFECRSTWKFNKIQNVEKAVISASDYFLITG